MWHEYAKEYANDLEIPFLCKCSKHFLKIRNTCNIPTASERHYGCLNVQEDISSHQPCISQKNTLFELEIIHDSPIMGSSYSFTKIKSGICFRLNGHRKS